MKKPKRSLFLKTALLLMAAVGLSSCRHSDVHDALVRAEALMETDPQQARAVLAEIEDSILKIEDYPAEEAGQKTGKNLQSSIFNFQSKKEASLYAWLKVQADFKCDIPLTSDSLARIATDYYGVPRRKNYHAAMAWYTLGCVYTDMHQTEDAFAAYMKAQRMFPTAANRYYSLCEQNIGKCYLDRNMNDDAIFAFRRCRESAVSIGDSAEIAWSDFFLGRCFLYKEDYDEADSLFSKASENPHAATAIRKRVLFERSKISHYRDGDYDEALRLLRSFVKQVNNPAYCGAAWTQMGSIFSDLHRLDSAVYYYNKALQQENDIYTVNSLHYELLSLKQQEAGSDSLLALFDTFVTLRDSLRTVNNRTEIIPLKEQFEYEQIERRVRQRFFIVLSIIVFLFFFLLVWLLVKANRRKRAYIQVFDELKQSQMEKVGRETELETELHDIKQRYLTQAVRKEEPAAEGAPPIPSDNEEPATSSLALQEERKLLYQRQYEASEWARYFKKHQPDIKAKQFVTVADAEQFERYLSGLFVDMLVDMVKENPDLTDEDTLHCAMTLLGFKPSQIAYCSRTSSASCYTRRSRMKPKLTPEWYQFIFGKAAE